MDQASNQNLFKRHSKESPIQKNVIRIFPPTQERCAVSNCFRSLLIDPKLRGGERKGPKEKDGSEEGKTYKKGRFSLSNFKKRISMKVSVALLSLSALAFPQSGNNLPVGVYAPPAPGAVRSACPCMNTLSNHGYLRRDGGANPITEIKRVFSEVLNVGGDVSDFFINASLGFGMGRNGNTTIALGDINQEGQISHDVSLVRDDDDLGDALAINQTLVKQLISFSSNGKTISVGDLGKFRKARFQDSKARNRNLEFGLNQQFTAFGEASLLLGVFGTDIPVTTIESFLGQEKLPVGFQRRGDTLNMPKLFALLARLRLAAGIF
jgi:hypothetical protein